MEYVEIAEGGANRRGVVAEYPLDLKYFEGLADCYATTNVFTEDFKLFVETKKTVAGFNGKFKPRFIPIDIDVEGDLTAAQEILRQFINRVQCVYEINNADMSVYFSGHKGFHIEIAPEVFGGFGWLDADKTILIKNIALELAQGIDIDPVNYNLTRLWRIPNTVNSKSGLYKIQLAVYDAISLSPDDIRKLAQKPQPLFECDPVASPGLVEIKNRQFIQKPKVNTKPLGITPRNEKACIIKMLAEGVSQGERNNALFRMASYFLSKYPDYIVQDILYGWNSRLDVGLVQREIDVTIKSAKSLKEFGCNDEVLKKYCVENCNWYLRKKEQTEIIIKSIEDMERDYIDYIQNIEQQQVNLSSWLPTFSKVSRGFTAGEVLVVLAGTGVGKTAFLQNLLLAKPYPSLFFSYEMPSILLYERFFQINEGCPGEEVVKAYKAGNIDSSKLKEKLSNKFCCPDSTVTIEQIPDIVKKFEDTNKIKLAITAIDYLGLVKGGKGSRYERVSYIAESLKDVAKKTDTVVVCLAQVSRQGGMATGTAELDITSGKDSGSIENVGDMVIGMFKPIKENNELLRLAILKNRKGKSHMAIDCRFDGVTLKIAELDKQGLPPEVQEVKDIFGGSLA